jgi:hypothetical protein
LRAAPACGPAGVIVTIGEDVLGWRMFPIATRRIPVTPLIGDVIVV